MVVELGKERENKETTALIFRVMTIFGRMIKAILANGVGIKINCGFQKKMWVSENIW